MVYVCNNKNISIKIKNSSFTKILLITEFIKITNNINNITKKTVIKEKNNLISNDEKNILDKEKSRKINSELKLNKKNNTFDFVLNQKNKKIRINNTFATASKKYKEDFLKKWSLALDKASNSSEFITIAGILNDVEILVVGEKNIIFLAQYDSLLERLMLQISTIEKLLLDVYNVNYKIVFLLKDEWEFEREKYIANLKNLKQYNYIEEDDEIDLGANNDEDINKLLSIFGNDFIKYK